jgi:hypothetical protein
MTEPKLDDLPQPTEFDCIEPKFQHDGYTFRSGNNYVLADFPKIVKAEVFMFWRAGWVKVAGWPEPPARNPNRVITLDVHNIKHLGRSPRAPKAEG